MSLAYRIFKLRQKFAKKVDKNDLKCGTIIETFKGISTIIDISKSYVFSLEKDNINNPDIETSYVCDTHYYFEDENDSFFYEDILRIVGFNENWESLKPVCPNPNGEYGICYSFDKFEGRAGCLSCPLAETIPGGIFDQGDPLPGLTKQLKDMNIRGDEDEQSKEG